MDKRDLIVLACLRKDAKQQLTKMSRKTGIPVSTIFDRIKAFNNGLVKKHCALIDFSKLGYNTRALIVLKVARKERAKLQECLMANHSINTLGKIDNGFDFFIEAIFRHVKEVNDFIEGLEDNFKIEDKRISYLIEDLKREGFLEDILDVELVK